MGVASQILGSWHPFCATPLDNPSITQTLRQPLHLEPQPHAPHPTRPCCLIRWRKVGLLLRSYLGNSLHAVGVMTDPQLLAFALRRLRASCALMTPQPLARTADKFLKVRLPWIRNYTFSNVNMSQLTHTATCCWVRCRDCSKVPEGGQWACAYIYYAVYAFIILRHHLCQT